MIANQQWQRVQEEEQQNVSLPPLSNEILDLTMEIHAAAGMDSGIADQTGEE